VQRRAHRDGREVAAQIVQLVKVGLIVEGVSDAAVLERLVRSLQFDNRSGSVTPIAQEQRPFSFATDPATGLPVIESPPDAPIRSMTPEQFQALIDQTQLEEDLERAGLAVRQ
jgi:hypothetical protein